MRKKIQKVINHPLISGGSIIFIGSMLANVLNYLFNLGMGRFLLVSDYGILASLLSIINIFLVFSTTIITVFAKFSASFIGQNKKEYIAVLFKKGSRLIGFTGLVIMIIIIVLSSQIASFLHIKNLLLINIMAITLFIAFLSSVVFGILQGALKFISFSLVNIFSSLAKLVLGIGFVLLGFNVLGAMIAIFISNLVGYLFAFLSIGNFLKKAKNDLVIPDLQRKLSLFAMPVFLSSLGMTVFTSVDVILVKHFFQETVAGQYAALNLMGRSIFYIVSPIVFVFFPLIAQKKERNEHLFNTVLLSVFLTGFPAFILSMIYFFFPKLIINIFFPAQIYSSLTIYLGPFSLFILFFALSWLFNNFYLSIGKSKASLLTMIAAIMEIIYIIFLHENINQIINGLILISFLLLISLLLYYPYATRAIKEH